MTAFTKSAFTLTILLAGVATTAGQDAAKTLLDKLQGKWAVVAMERDGRVAPKAQCDSLLITISGDKMTLVDGVVPVVVHIIKLDPSKKFMDLMVPSGP